MKIIINGCGGRMGAVLLELISASNGHEVVAGVDAVPPRNYPQPVYVSFDDCDIKPDCIIDFSSPQALSSMLKFALKHSIPVVVATTGMSRGEIDGMKRASESIPVFFSANMSIGINLVKKLVQKAAVTLGDDFDIEIIEKHHNKKADSPSGTAMFIADSINEALAERKEYIFGRKGTDSRRSIDEIGIHAVRGGSIVGDHEVWFIGDEEIVEIAHNAVSRRVFAKGALRAAEFILVKKPGMYSMDDLIGSVP